MGRILKEGEFSALSGGLNTDTSPLNAAPNNTLDEANFTLEMDGSRRRRLGLKPTNFTDCTMKEFADDYRAFYWKRQNGPSFNVLIRVQASLIYFTSEFDSYEYSASIRIVGGIQSIGFATLGDKLFIATGDSYVTVATFDGSKIELDYFSLKVRDFWGASTEYTDGADKIDATHPVMIKRLIPSSTMTGQEKDNFYYNLRNSGFDVARVKGKSKTSGDPLAYWRSQVKEVETQETSFSGTVSTSFPGSLSGTITGGDLDCTISGTVDAWQDNNRIPRRWAYPVHISITGDTTQTISGELEHSRKGVIVSSSSKEPLFTFVFDGTGTFTGTMTTKRNTFFPPLNYNLTYGIRKDASASNPYVDRFFPDEVSLIGDVSQRAPMGSFIIDLLDRGSSRENAYFGATSSNKGWEKPEVSLLTDRTEGGVTTLCGFENRLFYAGFAGEVTDEEGTAPNLSNVVAFSRVITSDKDWGKCYQENSPTSTFLRDLFPDDGGYIIIPECVRIIKIVGIGKFVVIFGTNGIWAIRGPDNGTFSATSFSVDRISYTGIPITRKNSVVETGDAVLYLTETSVNSINTELIIEDVSEGKITKEIMRIGNKYIRLESSAYDEHTKNVHWGFREDGLFTEIILNTIKGVFTKNLYDDVSYVKNCAKLKLPATANRGQDTFSVCYILPGDLFNDTRFLACTGEDFKDLDVNVDSFMISGFLHDEGVSRQRQSPYIYFYLKKTEDGFIPDGQGGIDGVSKESSCLIQSRWDWNDSPAGNKWGTPFQAYRHRRQYISTGLPNDPYNTGESMVVTRNKIPGRGRTMNIKIFTEPGKDLIFLGWSISMASNEAP